MKRLALVGSVCIVGACWTAPSPSSPSTPPTAPSTWGAARFGFVPDDIVNQLGSASAAIGAIDLRRAPPGLGRVLGVPACARAIGHTGVIVAELDQALLFARGLPEVSARVCIEQYATKVGATTSTSATGALIVRGPTEDGERDDHQNEGSDNSDGSDGDEREASALSITWSADLLTLRAVEMSALPSGPPRAALRALVAQVPADAFGFIVATEYPTPELRSFVYWVRVVGDDVIITAHAEATKPGTVGPLLQMAAGGMAITASQAGRMLAPSAIHETVNEPTATMEAHLPMAWFTGSDLPPP